MRLVAQIPVENQKDGITWLVIEEDKYDTKGVFLYCHRLLNEKSEYDTWHDSIENAKSQAELQWGVSKFNWRPAE